MIECKSEGKGGSGKKSMYFCIYICVSVIYKRASIQAFDIYNLSKKYK